MDNSIIVALITMIATVSGAALTYYFAKKREIALETRRDKLSQYRALLSSISDLAVAGKDIKKANEGFALAVNTIALAAPQHVIIALMDFHDEIKWSNKNRRPEKHDELLIRLLIEIRKDLGVGKGDDPSSFQYHLVGSAPQTK